MAGSSLWLSELDVEKNSLFHVQCTLENSYLHVLCHEKVVWLAEQTSVTARTSVLYFFCISCLHNYRTTGVLFFWECSPEYQDTVIFSLSPELASLQLYAHSSAHQWWSSRPSRQPG